MLVQYFIILIANIYCKGCPFSSYFHAYCPLNTVGCEYVRICAWLCWYFTLQSTVNPLLNINLHSAANSFMREPCSWFSQLFKCIGQMIRLRFITR